MNWKLMQCRCNAVCCFCNKIPETALQRNGSCDSSNKHGSIKPLILHPLWFYPPVSCVSPHTIAKLTPRSLFTYGCLRPKGQVTRAQEAEENYLVKRELTTVKQQSEEATAQLEKANNTIRQLQQQQQPEAVRRATESPAGRLHWTRSCCGLLILRLRSS